MKSAVVDNFSSEAKQCFICLFLVLFFSSPSSLIFLCFSIGWSSGTSLKGFPAIPNGRPLFQHWWLRSLEPKIFLYDLSVYLVTLGRGDLPRSPLHFGLLLPLCTARKSYWCLLLFKVKAKSFSKHRGKEPWFPKRPLSAVPTLFRGSSSSSEISGLRQCELTYLSGAHRACWVWDMLQHVADVCLCSLCWTFYCPDAIVWRNHSSKGLVLWVSLEGWRHWSSFHNEQLLMRISNFFLIPETAALGPRVTLPWVPL